MYAFVGHAIAVVVNAVADFGSAGFDGCVVVVAVSGGGHQFNCCLVTGWSQTSGDRSCARLAVAVIVGIIVPDLAGFFEWVGVVAIGVVGDIACWLAASHLRHGRIAKRIAIHIAVPGVRGVCQSNRACSRAGATIE